MSDSSQLNWAFRGIFTNKHNAPDDKPATFIKETCLDASSQNKRISEQGKTNALHSCDKVVSKK
jgi:hypothetical protein